MKENNEDTIEEAKEPDPSYKYMAFVVKLLTILKLWQTEKEDGPGKWKNYKNYVCMIVLIPSSIPCTIDCIAMITEPDVNITVLTSSIVATVCSFAQHYMCICFVVQRERIKHLVTDLASFAKYSAESLEETDRWANLFSKVVITYSMIGIIFYISGPLLSQHFCESTRSQSMDDYGIPCGLVLRVRPVIVRIDSSPFWYWFFLLHQVYFVVMLPAFVISISTLICGILMHITNQLKQLRQAFKNLANVPDEEIMAQLNYCIKYHQQIITFNDKVNQAFGPQMLMHVTLTSFLISVILFNVLMIDVMSEIIRHTLHLCGWFILLFTLCHYGQALIDESDTVGYESYLTNWYSYPTSVRDNLRMVILRSRKPLVLNAMSFGSMSRTTFLSILSTSYSYFTLLLQMK